MVALSYHSIECAGYIIYSPRIIIYSTVIFAATIVFVATIVFAATIVLSQLHGITITECCEYDTLHFV